MCENTITKYTAKDSVFVDLFSNEKYLFELYQALHPEDQMTRMSDLKTITLKCIIAEHMYNDLGFRVGNRWIILVEAQSSWSSNIIIRAWYYLAKSYLDYFHDNGISIYGNKRIQLPIPELYVIYTGNRFRKPKVLRLSNVFFQGRNCDIEVKIHMIYRGKKAVSSISISPFAKSFQNR